MAVLAARGQRPPRALGVQLGPQQHDVAAVRARCALARVVLRVRVRAVPPEKRKENEKEM